MSFDVQRLLELLPAVYRIRDIEQASHLAHLLSPAEHAELQALTALASPTPAERERLLELRERLERGPLRALLIAFAEQVGLLEENLDQLYDDIFVETCAEWAVPYIGDLIGYRTLHGVVAKVASRRAEVAHTIAFRRRKGTAAMLEQLARDVTGWNARAVEFFEVLATTQHMNHRRPGNHYGPDLRAWEPLERLDTAFNTITHTVDVRAAGRGRYNIPNVGLFLWRLDAQPLTHSPAVRVDDRRYLFDPRGVDQPLITFPEPEDEVSHIAEPLNVPEPISRRVLASNLSHYYGENKSIRLFEGIAPVPEAKIRVCNLDDDGATWAHLPPAGFFAIDPVRGRIGLPPTTVTDLRVTFSYAFSAHIGGGEYDRGAFADDPLETVRRVPNDHATIQAAINALGGAGVVEIADTGRYAETLQITASAGKRIQLRAANGHRPTIVLGGPMKIAGGADSRVSLNGLLILEEPIEIEAAGGNALANLELSHCTLVPGRSLTIDGTPNDPGLPSLVVSLAGVGIQIDHAILGAVRVHEQSTLAAAHSIIDANGDVKVAYAAPDNQSPGGALSLESVTSIGKVHTTVLQEVSNSIFVARLAAGDPPAFTAPVRAARTQEGCVRFSFLPLSSRVPRRHRCQPVSSAEEHRVTPQFTSLRYASGAYAQLAASTPVEIRRGAEDEGEMGAFHHLYQPQRETDLRVRLDEYLRVGLDAGIFYES